MGQKMQSKRWQAFPDAMERGVPHSLVFQYVKSLGFFVIKKRQDYKEMSKHDFR